MGLFDKKICDFCGAQIGLLGNRKLEDGNMCKECASKISPFVTDRRRTSVAEMKQHLQYREQNKTKLASFRPTTTLGNNTKVYIDRSAGTFVVSRSTNYRDNNADVIPLSEVTGCEVIIDEDRDEIYAQGQNGSRVSYNPPRYKYSYEIKIQITLSNQWFDEINFDVSENEVDNRMSPVFQQYEQQAYAIKSALTGMNSQNAGGMYGQQGFQQQAAYGQQNFQQQAAYGQQGFQQQAPYGQQNFQQQAPYGQQNFQQQAPYGQQNFQQQAPYGQQGFQQQAPYGQQNFQQQAPYGQQGFQQQAPYGQQNFQQTDYNQQGYQQQNAYGQQNVQQAAYAQQDTQQMNGTSWVCPACGMTNTGAFCEGCGTKKA